MTIPYILRYHIHLSPPLRNSWAEPCISAGFVHGVTDGHLHFHAIKLEWVCHTNSLNHTTFRPFSVPLTLLNTFGYMAL